MSIKKRIILISIMITMALSPMIIGCDQETKYKILTFFFEGVPDPNAPEASTFVRSVTDSQGEEVSAVIEKPVDKQKHSSRHRSIKDCNNCHAGSKGLGRRTTKQPVPELCYSCHDNYNEQVGFMHGPISVGDCTFCHDAHQSLYVYLQKDRQPDLCYLCHMQNDIKSIIGHDDKLEAICTDCHDPHISSEKKLLRPIIEESIDDPNTVDLGR